jgi:hypothetical protein
MLIPLGFGVPGPLEWVVILLVFSIPVAFLIVAAILMTRRIQKSQAMADGPGRFCVLGVDRTTRMDRELVIAAASLENARIKAELEGIIVTRISRENPAC